MNNIFKVAKLFQIKIASTKQEDVEAAFELINEDKENAEKFFLSLPSEIQIALCLPQYINANSISILSLGLYKTLSIIMDLITQNPHLYLDYKDKLRQSIVYYLTYKYTFSSYLNDISNYVKLIRIVLADDIIDQKIKTDLVNKTKQHEGLRRVKIAERKKGRNLPTIGYKEKYVQIFRAVPINIKVFEPMSYVTLSRKWAKGHAEHSVVVNDESYHVLTSLVEADKVFETENVGANEYYYDGPEKKGQVIFVVTPEIF